jgi:hypothetical protein
MKQSGYGGQLNTKTNYLRNIDWNDETNFDFTTLPPNPMGSTSLPRTENYEQDWQLIVTDCDDVYHATMHSVRSYQALQ